MKLDTDYSEPYVGDPINPPYKFTTLTFTSIDENNYHLWL
jgi:hypothetical protein